MEAYKLPQLKAIITNRVKDLGVFEDQAITLCAIRIAAETGDVRKSLQVCRMALDHRIKLNVFAEASEGKSEEEKKKLYTGAISSVNKDLITDADRKFLGKVSMRDMNLVEVDLLRSNPLIDKIGKLPLYMRWLLTAVVDELGRKRIDAEQTSLLSVMKQMRNYCLRSNQIFKGDNRPFDIDQDPVKLFEYFTVKKMFDSLVSIGVFQEPIGAPNSADGYTFSQQNLLMGIITTLLKILHHYELQRRYSKNQLPQPKIYTS